MRRRAAGVTTALVIDEAQCLARELLEEVRLLSNIETPTEKLLPLVLAGQPELADRLNLPSLGSSSSAWRCAARWDCSTRPRPSPTSTGRIRIAGGQASTIFTREALSVVHRGARAASRGPSA